MSETQKETSITAVKILEGNSVKLLQDNIAVEVPLELILEYHRGDQKQRKAVALLMRSPGRDIDLCLGLLYSEQFIQSYNQVASFKYLTNNKQESALLIQLHKDVQLDEERFTRNTISNSSCGLCSRESAQDLFPNWVFQNYPEKINFQINHIYKYLNKIKSEQSAFKETGGMHASCLFNTKGELVRIAEDVGRHNALDKLIGYALRHHEMPIRDHALLLSGRCSYELIYKSALAKIPLVVSIGAPSSLSIDWARELDISLIGFLRSDRMNIYHDNGNLIYNS